MKASFQYKAWKREAIWEYYLISLTDFYVILTIMAAMWHAARTVLLCSDLSTFGITRNRTHRLKGIGLVKWPISAFSRGSATEGVSAEQTEEPGTPIWRKHTKTCFLKKVILKLRDRNSSNCLFYLQLNSLVTECCSCKQIHFITLIESENT